MLLEDKIRILNHNTRSSINVSGAYMQDKEFQQSCEEMHSNFLFLDDEKKLGFMDNSTYITVKKDEEQNDLIVREVKNIVWTDHGPLVRTMEIGANSQGNRPCDKYHNIYVEGYFMLPSNPTADIPPRYEYARVLKSYYYNLQGEEESFVRGIAKVDDKFCSFEQAVEPRGVSTDQAFDLFEGQVNSAISLAQPLPLYKAQGQELT